MLEIVKYFMLTDIYSEIDRRTLDPLKLIECGAWVSLYYICIALDRLLPFPSRHFRYTYSTVDFWIMYKNLHIHAMRATFHIVFSVRI